MKKHKTVIAAEAAYEAKKAEMQAAELAAKNLALEVSQAYAAIQAAQTLIDADLPQCVGVAISQYSKNEEDRGRFVIVRKTPGGLLVVRKVGDHSGNESKYKWSKGGGKFCLNKARGNFYLSKSLELRDVPPEFLPVEATQDTQP